jgi:prolyl 4-hydroxylase
LSSDPHILFFHNFTSDEEGAELIRVGGAEYKPSAEGGSLNKAGLLEAAADQTSNLRRTSESSFCIFECNQDETLKRITKRAAELVGVPEQNIEYIQLLKYGEGQYYKSHHDNNPNYFKMPMGPRIYTLFLYLSNVEEGGETDFPQLGLKVSPKKGGAVLWPSVQDGNPDGKSDMRTYHQALPVLKGMKYAANIWIYMYDYKTQWQNSCTG